MPKSSDADQPAGEGRSAAEDAWAQAGLPAARPPAKHKEPYRTLAVLAVAVRTQAHQHIGPGAVDDQRPGGIRQSPLTRIHDVPDKAGTVIVSPSSPGTGCTPTVVTAASSAVSPRNRDQQRLHQPLDRSRQSGTRHHPRQARQRIRADTARQQHTTSTAHGDLRGRPSSTPALEHDNRIGSG